MQLSQRLSSVASMVTAGNCLADVGTDHGYVPIYLYERNVIPRAIAMDVNKGPLERAALHIAESGMKDVIETRLSDGLTALRPKEADSIVIAGMGGPLMIRILSAYPEVTASAKELILQPQSEIAEVRIWLYEQGYEIVEEHMVYEEGKYYPMFKAVKNPEAKKLSYLEYKFGRLEVLKEKEVLKDFILRELSNKQNILQKLEEEQTEKSKGRAEEMKQLIKELEEMQHEM
ncbi:MAG: tRNA (adenine(22)-N(1))-methyltransferase TrmK [Lachnospiraceae bacterium]|nr:tRNA (adenine(22)-N(1))-methyltransferase TrmK [Lachnospiraceae bacterium]